MWEKSEKNNQKTTRTKKTLIDRSYQGVSGQQHNGRKAVWSETFTPKLVWVHLPFHMTIAKVEQWLYICIYIIFGWGGFLYFY